MEHHFRNPDAYVVDPNYPQSQRLKQGIDNIAKTAGQIAGIIGAGRAYENEVKGAAKDAEYNAAIEAAGTWGGTAVGIGVGLASEPFVGPGGVIVGDMASTAADEIIGAIVEGSLKDSSGEVIYRNGASFESTNESTYKMVEEAAKKAGTKAGRRYPLIEASVATSAQSGFDSARTKVHNYFDGEGIPRQLDTEE